MSAKMNIELGKLANGDLILVSDAPFAHDIRRIEFYRDQRLIMLVYNDPHHEGDLMHHEIPDIAVEAIESCPTVTVVDKGPNNKLYGYDVPLVRVGEAAELSA